MVDAIQVICMTLVASSFISRMWKPLHLPTPSRSTGGSGARPLATLDRRQGIQQFTMPLFAMNAAVILSTRGPSKGAPAHSQTKTPGLGRATSNNLVRNARYNAHRLLEHERHLVVNSVSISSLFQPSAAIVPLFPRLFGCCSDDASLLRRGSHEEGRNQTGHNGTDARDSLPVETAAAAATCLLATS